MSLLHIGHEMGGGRLEVALILALTFALLWLHVVLLGLSKRKDPSSESEDLVTRRRR